jgi:hypothetical protein
MGNERHISEAQMDKYLQGVADASQRSRTVMLMLVTVSVLTFFAILGQTRNGWVLQREQVSSDALHWWPLTNRPQEFYTDIDSSSEAQSNVCGRIIGFLKRELFPSDTKSNRYSHAQGFVADFANTDPENIGRGWLVTNESERAWVSNRVATYNADAHRVLAEKVKSFTIPVFGVTVDINHLGLLSGLSFFMLGMVQAFFLRREIENLRYAFQAAEEFQTAGNAGSLRSYYELLASHHVFTIPPAIGIPGPGANLFNVFFRRVSLSFLFWLPAFMQLSTATYESMTSHGFTKIFPRSTRFEVVSSWFLFVLVFIVGLLCWRSRLELRAQWKHWASIVRSPQKAAVSITKPREREPSSDVENCTSP